MALQAQQIVTLACQIAKVPGFTSQGGQMLNMILADLAETYDFDVARGKANFNFVADNGSGNGTGPYTLPADYLRADPDDVFWTLQGVQYVMTNIDLAEFDAQVEQAGLASYPYWYATDMSQSPPVMFVYPPASGAYPVTVRYRRQMPDIAIPETSTTIPWFPNTDYLVTRLAGEIMKITDDERTATFLGEGPDGAQGILNRYLKLKDDSSNRSKHVRLDRRRFGPRFSSLPNTKTVGW